MILIGKISIYKSKHYYIQIVVSAFKFAYRIAKFKKLVRLEKV